MSDKYLHRRTVEPFTATLFRRSRTPLPNGRLWRAAALATASVVACFTLAASGAQESSQPETVRGATCMKLAAAVDTDQEDLGAEAAGAEARRTGDSARRQADAARRQADAIRRDAQDLQRGYGLLAGAWTGGNSRGLERSLIIPKNGMDSDSLAETEDDLNVMARILERAASSRGEKTIRAMGIFVRTPFDSASAPGNLYLEGYGAVFFLRVDYPLLAPAANKDKPETKEDPNGEWEQARRELLRQPEAKLDFDWYQSGPPAAQGEPYEPERVEELTKNLAAAIKNASHIRKLKSDEVVVVVVNGRGPARSAKVKTKPSARSSESGPPEPTPPPPPPAVTGTRMLLRAKASDIDAFAKQQLSLEEFRKRLTVMVY